MKSKKSTILFIVIAIFFGLASVANAQKGVELGDAVSVTAEVVSIDKEARTVVVRGPEGNEVEIDVPEEARNFDQIEVGDQVNVTYYESVALFLGKPGTQPEGKVDMAGARAEKGEKPGGVVVQTAEISAKVTAIDKDNNQVSLQGPEGNTVTVSVDPEVNDLKNIKVGDSVHARITKAIAISVEKGME